MDIESQNYSACTQCAKTKARCDKKMPCTRCIMKNLVCEPRMTRRSLKAIAQRQHPQLRALEPQSPPSHLNESDGERMAASLRTPTSIVIDSGPARPRSSTASPKAHAFAKSNSQQASRYQSRSSSRGGPEVVRGWRPYRESDSRTEEESVISSNGPGGTGQGGNAQGDTRMVDSTSADHAFLHIDNPSTLMDLEMDDLTNPMFCDLGLPDQQMTPFDVLLGSWADEPSYLYSDSRQDDFLFGPEPVQQDCRSDSAMYHMAVEDDAVLIAAQEAWPLFNCNPKSTSAHYPSTASLHLQGLEETLTSDHVWTLMYDTELDPSPNRRIVIESFPTPSRDKLSAVAQILFHNARSNGSGALHDPLSLKNAAQMSTSFIILPPTSIMDSFLRTYGNCFESYYKITPGHTFKPGEMMGHNDSRLPTLLILLMLAFGAMQVPTIEARHIAGGLTEVCRVGLWNVLGREMALSSDPLLSHCALLYLTLGMWSGDKWQMDVSMTQKAMFISMLRDVEIPKPIPGDQGYTEGVWKHWKEQEGQNRLKYAWVMADQEWSLFLGSAAAISVDTLLNPLPSADDLWKADTATEWARVMKTTPGADFPSVSLRDLYKSFSDGEVLKSRQRLCTSHLRLLLHPIQGMVWHLRQSLHCFTEYGSGHGSSRALSQSTAQAQLNQARQSLQQWYTLSTRCSPAETNCSPIFFFSLILYHLITLNTLVNFTAIEEEAARGSSQILSYGRRRAQREDSPWLGIFQPDDTEEIFFHCGQLMRLFCAVPRAVQAIWWPAVLYRTALTAWFTSMAMFDSPLTTPSPRDNSSSSQSTNHASAHSSYQSLPAYAREVAAHANTINRISEELDPTFAIDALSPDDPTLVRYLKYKEGEPALSRPGGGYISLRDPPDILKHCVDMLNICVSSRLRDGTRNKLNLLAERWGS